MKTGLWLLTGVFLLSASLSSGVTVIAGEHAMTGEEVSQLIGTAKTAADHELLATYFDREAADVRAKAELHRQFEARYKNVKYLSTPEKHCARIAKDFEGVAANASALANEHREMAKARQHKPE